MAKRRAKKCGRVIHDNNMWLKFPDRIDHWYKEILATYEPAVQIHRIDGTQSPQIVQEEFNDLLSDIKKGIRV